METVLVTGGAGFIGSHTCKALAASRSILQLSSMSGRDVTERSKAALVEHNS